MGEPTEIRENNILTQDALMRSATYRSAFSVLSETELKDKAHELSLKIADTDRVIEEDTVIGSIKKQTMPLARKAVIGGGMTFIIGSITAIVKWWDVFTGAINK